MKTEIKKLPKSELEIQFEMPAGDFTKYVEKALEHLKGHVKMDGFRKGKVPTSMVEERVGGEQLLMEAGELAVKAAYPKFMEENNLEPIGDPDVQITKIAKGSEFCFTVKVTILPEVKLPDYKEIVKSVEYKDVSVTDAEVQETIDYLQKSRAKFTTENRPAKKGDFLEIEYSTSALNEGKAIRDRFILGEGGFLQDFEEQLMGLEAGQEKEFTSKFPDNTPRKDLAGKEATFKVKVISVQKMEMAQINDDFAKTLGAFDTLVALKQNLREGITAEKAETEKQRARGEMLEKISIKMEFEIPPKMAEYEQERLLEDLKIQVNSQFGTSFEKYLEMVKKTEEEIKATYKLEAEKRIKNFLVLREIGREEKVEVTPEEVATDLPKLMKNYTKEQLAQIDIARLTEYSKGAIFNEKVFQLLETFAKKAS